MVYRNHLDQLRWKIPMLEYPFTRHAMIDFKDSLLTPEQFQVVRQLQIEELRIPIGSRAQQGEASYVVQQAGRVAGIAIHVKHSCEAIAQDRGSQVMPPAGMERIVGNSRRQKGPEGQGGGQGLNTFETEQHDSLHHARDFAPNAD